MRRITSKLGYPQFKIDTPALLLDLDALEHNLKYMADFFANREVKIRPHVKLHKATPVLAHMVLSASDMATITRA